MGSQIMLYIYEHITNECLMVFMHDYDNDFLIITLQPSAAGVAHLRNIAVSSSPTG